MFATKVMSNCISSEKILSSSSQFPCYVFRKRKQQNKPKLNTVIEFNGKWREEKAMKNVKVSWKCEYGGEKGKD